MLAYVDDEHHVYLLVWLYRSHVDADNFSFGVFVGWVG
jgi:hypothetical protein